MDRAFESSFRVLNMSVAIKKTVKSWILFEIQNVSNVNATADATRKIIVEYVFVYL